MEIVTVDIGGTHARFAIATIADDGTITLGEPETLHTDDHASFQTAWEDVRKSRGGKLPDAIAMAIAGPVGGDVIRFTNNPWIIRPALVKEKLGVARYTIVNDFEAVAHAVARAPEDQFLHLTGPDRPLAESGTLSVLGPGTGLGVAHLVEQHGGDGAHALEREAVFDQHAAAGRALGGDGHNHRDREAERVDRQQERSVQHGLTPAGA